MLTFYPSRILDPGVKKAPDPRSGSATLGRSITVLKDIKQCCGGTAIIDCGFHSDSRKILTPVPDLNNI
jgi:hypothetical protein